MRLILLWIALCTPFSLLSVQAEESFSPGPAPKARNEYLSGMLNVGATALSLSGSGSLTAYGVNVQLRKGIGRVTPFTCAVTLIPTFTSSSLLTVQVHGSVGYRLIGEPKQVFSVEHEGFSLAELERGTSPFQLYVDAGLSVLPIFGSYSTATYSGPMGGLSAYFSGISAGASISVSSLAIGERKATAINLSFSYFFGFI